MSFVHLHVHSAYSLLDGAIKIKDLVKTAKGFGMPAVALTDHGQMFGVYNFYQQAVAEGIKPIIGVETYVSPDRFARDKNDPRWHLVLLAKNIEGWKNLLKIITAANTEGFYYKPRVDHALLKEHSGGLIALTACLQGELPRAVLTGKEALIREALERHRDIFGDDLYLEVQENEIPAQTIVNQALLELSKKTGVPLVATNDCHYLKREDYEAHDVLLCIQTASKVADKDRMRMPFNTYWLRSPDEMRSLFRWCPEACDNTLKIADKVDLELPPKAYRFPKIKTEGGLTADETLAKKANEGLEAYFQKREGLGTPLTGDEKAAYRERLAGEVKVICQVGFAGYFLIVADFILWAKSRKIPVGPGRGSAAGSLTAFALGITSVDSMRFGLLFERFLNPQRVSMPDIDVDFCAEGRAEVLDYVIGAYGGPDHVAQILTLGQLKARAVIRDVARAMDIPLSEADRLAKMVPEGVKMTLDKALELEPRLKSLYDKDPRVKKLISVARTLEGLPRHASVHASGVVIADKPLTEYLPLFAGGRNKDKEKGGGGSEGPALTVTQFEGSTVEALGLIKFDFLGLKTLTLIKHCLRLLKERGIEVDVDAVPLDDPQTFEFFRHGNLSGVFQMEQEGIRQYLRSIRPEKIDDIMLLLALYRPGPLKSGQADQFVAVRQGASAPKFPHPSLIPILSETAGVILYQEQVLKIVQVLAGFTLGEADILRRVISKKNQAEMDKIRPDFIKRCLEAGLVGEALAKTIFAQLEKFAEYGFNKSHAAAYALVSYQTAWLKCRYAPEFMAALMTAEMADTDKISALITECRESSLEVLPPDVNSSGWKFTVDNGRIRFGLGAIKGVGQGAIEAVLEARAEKKFSGFFDFCERVADRKANKRTFEALILSGALDASGGASRSVMLASLEKALSRRRRQRGGEGIPAARPLFAEADEDSLPPKWAEAGPFPDDLRLEYEKKYLGFYVTGHPLRKYELASRVLGLDKVGSVQGIKRKTGVRVMGSLSAVKMRTGKTGKPFAFAAIEDFSGRAEIILWSEALEGALARGLLDGGKVILLEGAAEPPQEDSAYGSKIIVNKLWDLETDLPRMLKSVTLTVSVKALPALTEFISSHTAANGQEPPGSGPAFYLRVEDSRGWGVYRLDRSPSLDLDFLRGAAELLGGPSAVSASFGQLIFERALGRR